MINPIRFRRLAEILFLLSAAASGPATARTLAGVTMPDTMAVQGNILQLNGMGIRSFTFLQIHGYVAGLYLSTLAHRAQTILDTPGIKLLRIQYVHAASTGRIKDELQEGHRKICVDGCPRSGDAAFAQLLEAARAVKPGDTTTYVFSPLGVQILFNEQNVTTIQNSDFSQRMLGGMLGMHPPSEALRDGLLGVSTE